ncbi:MAG: flagellar biosynthesis protein [Intestinimonas sp.]|jgi:flagellar operon protein|nr:flagellar biosynthesis protein [Intestinimonas sp.]
MIDSVFSPRGVSPQVSQDSRFSGGSAKTSFRNILREKQQLTQESQPVTFSKHARERAEERGIQVDDALMTQLSDSVEKAQEKGARNILAFDATHAFIINVPNGRVITTMSQDEMKENIFTNIDGAVIL